MLVLDARFVLLAAFCSFATLTFSPCWGVGAAAIQSRSFCHGQFHNVTSDRPSLQHVLPLPLQSKAKQFKVRTHEWLHSNLIALFADIAFARLKDNTPRVPFRKRGDYSNLAKIVHRSVLIPNSHGSEYIVSHSRRPVHQRRRQRKVRMLGEIEEGPLSRRAQEAIVGNVALMSTDRQLAMLFAAPGGSQSWTLYASETNKTQFHLVPASMESTSDLRPVTLEMGAPGETRTCATYNSNPPQNAYDTKDENMTMEPCHDRATPETGHKSQIFLYDGNSGKLEPTWNSGADGANTTVANSPANQNTTTLSNATQSSSAALPAMKQNSTVTLVFTPVKAMVADVGTEQNYTTTEKIMTKTKTVTVFNVASTSAGVSSATSNTASQVTSSALDVQLVGAPMPTTASASASTSSTATRSIDAAAIASGIAASASASSASASASSASAAAAAASAAASSTAISSTNDVSPSSTQEAQRRAYRRLAGYNSKVHTISTGRSAAQG